MNEEDLENIKRVIDYIQFENKIVQGLGNAIYTDSLKRLLREYKKQSKEIKELNHTNKSYKGKLKEQGRDISRLQKQNNYYKECLEVCSSSLDNIDYDQIMFAVHDKFIEKKRIKDKIEEWDICIKWNNADDRYYAIKILKELLESEE